MGESSTEKKNGFFQFDWAAFNVVAGVKFAVGGLILMLLTAFTDLNFLNILILLRRDDCALLCGYDLPGPISGSFKLPFFQWTFCIFDKEPFGGRDQVPSAFLEPVCDALCGIAAGLDQET